AARRTPHAAAADARSPAHAVLDRVGADTGDGVVGRGLYRAHAADRAGAVPPAHALAGEPGGVPAWRVTARRTRMRGDGPRLLAPAAVRVHRDVPLPVSPAHHGARAARLRDEDTRAARPRRRLERHRAILDPDLRH